ncbi:hypothetical protein FDUTEX481_09671 [Tolypothrix sp. PCC 7601]|nr:hypothetical protein FDUTEX481_09671 [Tolypothrix sp. PCC 7601]
MRFFDLSLTKQQSQQVHYPTNYVDEMNLVTDVFCCIKFAAQADCIYV